MERAFRGWSGDNTASGPTFPQSAIRYRRHPMVIGDLRLPILAVAGRSRTSGSALFLASVERQLAVRAVTADDGSILLVEREPDQQAQQG